MKKGTLKKLYVILSVVLVASISLGLVYFNVFSKANVKKTGAGKDYANIERDTFISLDANGGLQIKRTEKEEVSMGKEDTWTLLLYMTGSNLESQYENATKDIDEIFRSKINNENIKNVNILIQTGGSTMWHSNNISNQKVQRYKVDANKRELTFIEDCGNKSMGNADTLYDFLQWGVDNYPAEHMGVIMWDHGSGVSDGLCNDEKFDNEALTVHELEYAFAKVSKKMTSKFEMISFDTCLSGSLEYANLLAPYGKYMVASADLEPGEGWYYTPIIDAMLNNPDINGADLGKVICENYGLYYDIMYRDKMEVNYTLATYDLSKVDKVCQEVNYFGKFLYDTISNNAEEYWNLEAFKMSCVSYNRANLDIGGILDYLEKNKSYDYNTTYFRQAVEDMIITNKLSNKYKEKQALGITLYMPSKTLNVRDLNYYRNVAFSPYLFKFVEWMNARGIDDNVSKIKTNPWEKSEYFFEKTFDFINYDTDPSIRIDVNNMAKNILSTNSNYMNDGFVTNWYDTCNFESTPFFGGAPLEIMRNVEVKMSSNETSAQLPKDELHKINAVYNTIFAKVNDELVCLGQNNKVKFNKETGEIKSSSECEWFMLPDGQLLTAYIVEQEDNKTVYAFPVVINDEESSIRIEETIDKDGKASYVVLGVWDFTTNNSDAFARGYLPLEPGTAITPIYDVFDEKTGSYESEYGEEYVVSGQFEFYFTNLNAGEYSFAYEVEKYNNATAFTDIVELNVQ